MEREMESRESRNLPYYNFEKPKYSSKHHFMILTIPVPIVHVQVMEA